MSLIAKYAAWFFYYCLFVVCIDMANLCTDFDCSLIFGLFLLTRKTRSLPYAGPVLVLAK